jgi:hypothetical protein
MDDKDLSALLAELGGDKPQNRAIAEGLQKQGITSIKDIGVKQVPVPGRWEGTDEASYYVPESTANAYFNKATGEEINPTRLGVYQVDKDGKAQGDIFFHLNADQNGNVKFDPQWSPRAHGFLRDNAVGQAIMAIGSIIPSPIQPFVMAAKGADALAHGNTLAGLAALTGAAGVADIGGLGSALKNVTTGLNVYNAVDQGNLAGAVNALTANSNLAGGLGSTPIGGTGFNLGDVGNAAGLAANLASGNPNIGAALGSVGSLTGNQDLTTAGRGVSLAQGIMSGNPLSALNSIIGLGKLGGTNTAAPIDDRSIPATGFDTSAFTDSGLQQPVSPDISAINTSGTTAMGDDWTFDEDIPSYDLSQYMPSDWDLFAGVPSSDLSNYDPTAQDLFAGVPSSDTSNLSDYIARLNFDSGVLGGETPPGETFTGGITTPTVTTPQVDPFQDIAPPLADPTQDSGFDPSLYTGLTSGVSSGFDSSYGDTPDRPTGVGPLAVWSPTTGMWEERDDAGNVLKYTRSGTLLTDRGTGPGFDASGKPIAGIPQKLTGIATTPAKTAATAPAKAGAPSNQPQGAGGLGSLLPLLLAMYAANQSGKGDSSGASAATIPALTATQMQTPYATQTQAPTYRPGQGGITYFNPVQYTPKMAAGGIAGLGAASGRFLKGAGDGVSDSIPATIGSNQPARLARGEFVVDARTVSELGNGSSEAGADKLLKMMERVHQARKKAGRGKDSHADRHMPA